MRCLLFLPVVLCSWSFARGEACQWSAYPKVPEVWAIGQGTPKDWKPAKGESASDYLTSLQQIRARLFKSARLRGVPFYSETFMSLNGRIDDDFWPALKKISDKNHPVYGLKDPLFLALNENYKSMDAIGKDRLKDSIFFRFEHTLFLTMKYKVLKNIWNEIYKKADDLKVGNLRMMVRRINNALVEFEEASPVYTGVGQVRPSAEMKAHFQSQIIGPLKRHEQSVAVTRRLLTVFHQRLVHAVNSLGGSGLLFYQPKVPLGNQLEALENVERLGTVRALKAQLCRQVKTPLLMVLVSRKTMAVLQKEVKLWDSRVQLQVFDLSAPEGRQSLREQIEKKGL